jgi:FkbH-like protein
MTARLSASEIALLMHEVTPSARAEAAGALLDRLDAVEQAGQKPDVEACDALLDFLEATDPAVVLSMLKGRSPSPVSAYLAAKTFTRAGAAADAANAWKTFFTFGASTDPVLLLEYSRLLGSLDRLDEAASSLKEALRLHPSYGFYPRASRLIDKLRKQPGPGARTVRLAVAGSSTTSLLIPVIEALCFRDGIDVAVYEAPYGTFRQEILDAKSPLHGFNPTITLILNHWRDLNLPPVSNDETSTVQEIAAGYAALWQKLHEVSRCNILQTNFDVPDVESHAYVAEHRPGGRTRVIHRLNLALEDAAPDYVSIVDALAALNEVGRQRWSDRAVWFAAKQHPSADALPVYAEQVLAHLRAITGLTRKVLVADLDNTMWGGIIGEDGLDGIRVGAGSPAGEAFADLQRYMLDLKNRGILLAVCSKNNPEDARLPFERHPGMILRLDDFVSFVANWRDKVENVKEIASQLALGLDSFVFLDDNPVERAWIRSQLPDVAVVALGGSPFSFVQSLDRTRLFYTLRLSQEDRHRTQLYHQQSKTAATRSAFGSLEDFLGELQMSCVARPVGPDNIGRVTQLVNKTNQFNLTTRRRTQAEIEQLTCSPGGWHQLFQLSDRFGDHGQVAVVFCAARDDAWEIDTWLMSCRVLGRQMELFMFDRIVEAARDAGVKRLIGIYRPTSKNGLTSDLFLSLGFSATASDASERRYELVVADVQRPRSQYIRMLSPASAP